MNDVICNFLIKNLGLILICVGIKLTYINLSKKKFILLYRLWNWYDV